MRIALKFSAYISVMMGVVVVLLAVVSIRREAQLIAEDVSRDTQLVATVLAATAERDAVRSDPAGAREWLRAIDRREPTVQVTLLNAADSDNLGVQASAMLRSGATYTAVRRGTVDRVHAYAPILAEGALIGAVEVSEALTVRDAFIRRTILWTIITIVLVTAGVASMGLLIGRGLVGRRVDRLVSATRTVAAGDLDVQVPTDGRDELADLAVELNGMVAQLVLARDHLNASTEERVRTEAQLRHAQRLATVGRLASGVAHEIGTPLNVIMGRAARIQRHSDDDSVQTDAKIVHEQSARVATIVRQLLDYSRRASPDRHRQDVWQLARRSLDMLELVAQEHGVTFELNACETQVFADVDRMQIEQAITNLALNGIQAMVDGGRLTVQILQITAGGSQMVGVKITDEGPGIDPAHLQSVFEPFYTTKEPGAGTGLGLSVALGILQDHGGDIQILREPTGGAAFLLTFPASSTPKHEEAP